MLPLLGKVVGVPPNQLNHLVRVPPNQLNHLVRAALLDKAPAKLGLGLAG